MKIVLIMFFGAVGSLCRFGVGRLAKTFLPATFPFGTILVNVLGCFAFGLIMQISLSSDILNKNLRAAITVGFLGAFTTFSTFGYETFDLIKQGQWLYATANASLNLILGILAIWMGMICAKFLLS